MVKLSDLFDVRYGQSLELNRLKLLSLADGGIPFVSRKMGDNGIAAYVEPICEIAVAPAGELTCALSGNGVLSTFLQEAPYYTAYHVARLSPLLDMTREQLLYYCTCIAANRFRYSYGRQANRTLKSLPVPSFDEIPDYVSNANVARFTGANAPQCGAGIPVLTIARWKSFKLGDIFDIRKGQRLTKADMLPGSTPYVGASDTANGVTAKVGQKAIHEGGTISVSYNGSVAEAFYQPEPYWATDDVNVLYPKVCKLTPATALFLCTIIRLEKYRFNYGRKWHLDRMRESIIKLPATKKGVPDWCYMARYIETLPYSTQIS